MTLNAEAVTRTLRVNLASLTPLIPAAAPEELPSSRDLILQALLHLPRLALADGTIDIPSAVAEIERLRASRANELSPLRAIAAPPMPLPSLDQLETQAVSTEEAEPIFAHFHYLRSFREDSVNIAALYRNRIVALCSVSPLDLPHITKKLPIASASEAAVISRVFAFDWAPRNVISYLLARTEQSIALNPGVRMLVTYVNPNMGFTASSFKAANWRRIGYETGTRYAYLRGQYITDRTLAALPASELAAVEYSHMHLLPLFVLGRFVDQRLARTMAQVPEFETSNVSSLED